MSKKIESLKEANVFKKLDGSPENALGVEISGGYTKSDVEEFKKAFEEYLETTDQVNVLVKIDELNIGRTEFGAFLEDSRYALKNKDKLGKIAIVGHSRLEEILVKMDNKIFGDRQKGREEKYFDVADISKAWDFIKS